MSEKITLNLTFDNQEDFMLFNKKLAAIKTLGKFNPSLHWSADTSDVYGTGYLDFRLELMCLPPRQAPKNFDPEAFKEALNVIMMRGGKPIHSKIM